MHFSVGQHKNLTRLLLLLLGGYGVGTTFDPQDFTTVVKSTPVVLRGQIGMSYADQARDADGVSRLYTFFEVKISEVLKSEIAAPTIMIRELGGQKDGAVMQVSGTAEFKRGEDVVLLLQERNAEGVYDLQGMMLGKLTVVQSAAGESLVGPVLATQGGGSGARVQVWTLAGLKHLAEQGKGSRSQAQLASSSGGRVLSVPAPILQRELASKSSGAEGSNAPWWGMLALCVLCVTSVLAGVTMRHRG